MAADQPFQATFNVRQADGHIDIKTAAISHLEQGLKVGCKAKVPLAGHGKPARRATVNAPNFHSPGNAFTG